jgi:hypothetical protein
MTVGDFLEWVSENDVPNDTHIIIQDADGYYEDSKNLRYDKGIKYNDEDAINVVLLVAGFNDRAIDMSKFTNKE